MRFTKSIGLACSGKEIYHFCFSKYKPPGGLCSEGRFNGGFFALRFCGAYQRGLFSEFYGILTYQLIFIVPSFTNQQQQLYLYSTLIYSDIKNTIKYREITGCP